MTTLVAPAEAVAALRRRLHQKWADAVCADLGVGEHPEFSVALRPGVSTGRDVERVGYATWHAWHMQWREFSDRLPTGTELLRKKLTIHGVAGGFLATLRADVDGAAALTGAPDGVEGVHARTVDLGRARAVASALTAAGAHLTPALLRALCRLSPVDVEVLVAALTWLRLHPDAGGWTLRQLPVPGMHTKWLDTHGGLLRDVAGRDVRSEVRPRPTVTHLTYVDPDHLASGHRRHDAWTTGDVHDIAYLPRIVLVVENRDCRLWFPETEQTVVVEGGGKAAAALLAHVPWVRAAEHVVYWGDIDAAGYAILDQFRAALAEPSPDGARNEVTSILMDDTDVHRYAPHGVNHDKAGRPIQPAPAVLARLTDAEATAYAIVATAGPAAFRRIEQEAIPLDHARTRLLQILRDPVTTGRRTLSGPAPES